jgi:hypothetical protein
VKLLARHVGDSDDRPSGSETFFRRLTLRHNGEVFLDRFGIGTRWFGIYVHRIVAPDPGLDLHDHPWPFVSLILRGGYAEEYADARDAARLAGFAKDPLRPAGTGNRGRLRAWGRWSIHRMPLTIAHRIAVVQAGTWTLVLRGCKSRSWGFYLPTGYVDQRDYDYRARRPVAETRHGTVA